MVSLGRGAGWDFLPPLASAAIGEMIALRVWPIPPPTHIHTDNEWHSPPHAFPLPPNFTFMLGFISIFPFALLQVWGFVSPALKPNERKPFKVLAPFSVLLFAIGAGFAWWVTPNALQWFTSYIEDFPGTALFQEAGTLTFFV